MPYLEIVEGSPSGPVHLQSAEVLIGRGESCDLVLKGRSVSRSHARLSCQGGAFFIEDMNSRYGTYLNGARIVRPTKLLNNDLIKIGDTALRFREGEPEPASAASPQEEGKTFILSTCDATVEPEKSTRVDPVLKLHAVMEILRCLRTAFQADDLLPKILESLFRIFPQASTGVILLLDEQDGRKLVLKASHSRPGAGGQEVGISQTILQQALEKKQGILSADAQSDDQFKASFSVSTYNIRSLMCVPFLSQSNEPLGVLQLHTGESDRRFTEEDLDILTSVASATAMALENLKLHEGLLAKEKMQRELQLARDMQQRFLPAVQPVVPGYQFFTSYQSALSVGGDYYGFIELPEDRLAIAVADVSGKGMPAAMLMARLSSDIRSAAVANPDPGAALQAVNRSLCEAEFEGKFVTLLLMVLDKNQHAITLANAGHPAPLLRRATGEIIELGKSTAGYPLNVQPGFAYQEATCSLEPGGMVLAYTDGVVEAMRVGGQLFGIERLKDCFAAGPDQPGAMGARILEEVSRFAAGRAQSDDITLVCFRRLLKSDSTR
ncbi:MAG: SpoIIE family protein phosphatase [Planctomycetes bacterium]|nr:SpoIIE family protein phosphatase [Planctomycetota bacterium]